MKLLLLASLTLVAQTTVKPPQLAVTVPAAGQVRIMALVGDTFKTVELGTGLTMTQTAAGYRIDASGGAAPATPILQSQRLARTSAGSYGPYAAGMLFRNGVVQTVGQDYNVSGGMFVPILPWDATDLVVLWTIGST